ncbi:LacI family DNA-binding transcriptional regulator [Solimonas soli]|uniref:LacI family DNA-binding transcriptional regulator n=1 Tax=Solimonas soli TaxID=413479 RepID=UPI0005BA1A2D|nr:LacI family DNA-binding transcriptional regulator [Solimonas soli]
MTRKRRSSGRATLDQVAELASTSPITVSRYFNRPQHVSEATRQRIAAAVAELGYVPNLAAGGLASAQARVIGLVLPSISAPIYVDTIQAFSDRVSRYGYQLLLASSEFSLEKEEEVVRAFLGWAPAALVVTGCQHTPGTEQMLARASVPVVEVWDYRPDRPYPQVGFAHDEVSRLAAAFLHERGYRRIAYAQTPIAGDLWAALRYEEFAACLLRDYGLATRLIEPGAVHPIAAGRLAIEEIMRSGDIDALFCANDNVASGAVLAAQRLGLRIPQQCAVLGFGDFPIAEALFPSLSSVRPPARDIGEVAADRVLEELGTLNPDASTKALACTLAPREST